MINNNHSRHFMGSNNNGSMARKHEEHDALDKMMLGDDLIGQPKQENTQENTCSPARGYSISKFDTPY